jgi:PPOX class probable F420-dependent enzyme
MLDPDVKSLAQAANFAAFSTLLPSGYPMTHVMWVHADDDHILINTEVHRTKFKNVERDPRVTVTVIDRDNPYRFAEVRGKVVEKITGDTARTSIDELAQKYEGRNYRDQDIQSERVLLKIEPDAQQSRG